MRQHVLPITVAACLLTALTAAPPVAADVVVGPGVVAAPYEIYGGGDYRFVAGTEIVSTQVTPLSGGATLLGGKAIYIVASNKYSFEGGRYEGASITAGPGVTSGSGGNAIELYTSTDPTLIMYDGLIRGGSSIIPAGAPITQFGAGAGVALYSRYLADFVMLGGVIEGGIVAEASAPMTALKRGFAIEVSGYEFARKQIDIYGGTLNGGVSLYGYSRFTVHGSELAITPDPTEPFSATTLFTLTGKYGNGVPFSHSVFANPTYTGHLVRGADSLTIELLYVPEPSGIALMLAALLPMRRFRSSRKRQLAPRQEELI